jgi:protocatechuate 3,4-dioxygenase beta subunit
MSRTRQFILLLSFLLAVILPFSASGQTSTGITGRLTDQTGAVIPNATVTLRNEATNQKITTISTRTGDYSFTTLRPGLYDIWVTAPGFGTSTVTA